MPMLSFSFCLLLSFCAVTFGGNEPPPVGESDQLSFSPVFESRTAKKRRYAAVRENPQWSRRIKKAVREGSIVLGMNQNQLRIVWGEPKKKISMFTSRVGTHALWVYESDNTDTVYVAVKNKEIIGWSQRN